LPVEALRLAVWEPNRVSHLPWIHPKIAIAGGSL
jgi:hypothetical protein